MIWLFEGMLVYVFNVLQTIMLSVIPYFYKQFKFTSHEKRQNNFWLKKCYFLKDKIF